MARLVLEFVLEGQVPLQHSAIAQGQFQKSKCQCSREDLAAAFAIVKIHFVGQT